MLELDSPSSLLPLCAELTIPEVIVFRKENGLPMATTNSPCRTSDERPRVSVGKGFCVSEQKNKAIQQCIRRKARMLRLRKKIQSSVTEHYEGLIYYLQKSKNLMYVRILTLDLLYMKYSI